MRLTNKSYDNDVLEIQKTRKVVRPDGGLGNYSQWDYNNDLWNYVKVGEDIEEELGIDSKIILQIIMTMKVWAIKDGRIRRFYVTDIVSYKKLLKGYITFGNTHNGWSTEEEVKFEDYGKTWALTKEELLWTNGKIKDNDYQIE